MTENRRIAINVIATYGRSLYTLVLGLFTARWSLAALGATDYGLLGLVGGLVGFISFFNSLLAVSTGRFFAYSIGQQKGAGPAWGVNECREWFTSAFFIHLILGLVLVAVGYPAGLWAVRHYLAIPLERVRACEVVWTMTCVTCFVSMVNVPFQAMYNAKQEIAEMTLFSLFSSTANAVFLYYAATHPRIWLAPYSVWIAVITLLPLAAMCARAFWCFPECRFTRGGVCKLSRIKALFGYSAAQFLAEFSALVRAQGNAILINKFLGPSFNASVAVGNRVADQALSLGSAMVGAMNPAITNAAGAGDLGRMRMLSFQACKLGTLFALFFAVPLMAEAESIMVLWLKNPPEGSAALCVCFLCAFILTRMTSGLSSSIEALGRIAAFKSWMGAVGLVPVFVLWQALARGYGVVWVGIAEVMMMMPFAFVRLYYARKLAAMSVKLWFRTVFLPVMCAWIVGMAVAFLPRVLFPTGAIRIVLAIAFSELVMLPAAWYWVFSDADREYIATQIVSRVLRIVRR